MPVFVDPRAAAFCPLSARELQALLDSMVNWLGFAGSALELSVVDDDAQARRNAEHLGLPGPTNILSFENASASGGDGLLAGSMSLSARSLRREAMLYGQDIHEHLVRLLAHGLLHVAGYEHGAAMEAATEELLDQFGPVC